MVREVSGESYPVGIIELLELRKGGHCESDLDHVRLVALGQPEVPSMMRILVKSVPENREEPPEGVDKWTFEMFQDLIFPNIRKMGLPHLTRYYTVNDAQELCETYQRMGCEAEVVE